MESGDFNYLEIAVPSPLPRLFTYRSASAVEPGSRVKVPFGPRSAIGVVMGSIERPDIDLKKIKSVREVVDETPIFDSQLMKLADWMSRYYIHPIGEVLRTMLPGGSVSQQTEKLLLTEKGQAARDEIGSQLKECFGKRHELTLTTARKKLKALGEDPSELLKTWQKQGLIQRRKTKKVSARKSVTHDQQEIVVTENERKVLTEQQLRAFTAIVDSGIEGDEKKPFLLQGVTGSGKTEVYLQLIAKVLEKDSEAQVLMLVPEISLTPQMTRVFEERFPGQIGVVHSAMKDRDRWEVLEELRYARKRVLIGPRSAVFAPFKNLQLILVDEEHDQSYKQSTGLMYNGRDVAVVRSQFAGATIVLGSATPSMETKQNAESGKYVICEMSERASGRDLPEVRIIESQHSKDKSAPMIDRQSVAHASETDEVPICDEIIEELQSNFKNDQQSIVIVNRRGFAYYLFDVAQKKAVECPECSISLTVHGRNQSLRCHYCDYKTTVHKILEEYPDSAFAVVGYGSQKVEGFLKNRLPDANIVRLDSDTLAQRDHLAETLDKFRRGEINILVGTQILAKGHDFPNVTLMAIVEVDQQMSLPDFRAGEKSFQLLVQASGRAGRAEKPGRVLVQTKKSDHPVVNMALKHDYNTFAKRELAFREMHHYPPFSRLAVIEYSGTDFNKLMEFDRRVEGWLEVYERQQDLEKYELRIRGPLYPPIQTVRGRHRRHILFSSPQIPPLQASLRQFLDAFQKLPGDMRMKVDIDPQSML